MTHGQGSRHSDREPRTSRRGTPPLILVWGVALVLALVGLAGVAQALQQHRSSVLSTVLWEDSDISVCWEPGGEAFDTEKGWVKEAVERTWAKHSALRFAGWDTCSRTSRGIRIRIAEDHPHTVGLGTELDGVPAGMVLNFTFKRFMDRYCNYSRSNKRFCIESISMHEFGHALGFTHEQNRDDAPEACRGEAQGTDGDFYVTPYDLHSIMNYCNPSWNGDGRLSELDIKGLQQLYGKPGDRPTAQPRLAAASIRLVNTAHKIDKRGSDGAPYYAWRLFVDAEPAVLSRIQGVRYYLHPTFNPNEIYVERNQGAGFPLERNGWGEFTIRARLYFDDGDTADVTHRLNLFNQPRGSAGLGSGGLGSGGLGSGGGKDGGGGKRALPSGLEPKKSIPQPPQLDAADFTLTNSATPVRGRDGQRLHQWTAYIAASPHALTAIRQVRYRLHPTFTPSEVVVSRGREDGFPLRRTGWGVFTLKADVELKDGRVIKKQHRLEF